MTSHLRSTFGSRGLARVLLEQRRRSHGDEHPATRAAAGRLMALRGEVPQRELHWHPGLRALGCADASTPEAVAWYRQSGADPGCANRRWRRYELTLRRDPGGLTVAA